MKLITAIVKSQKLDELVQALIDQGVRGLTVTEVRGFGRQYGQLATGQDHAAAGLTGPAGERIAALVPKVRLDLVVLNEDAETIVDVIAKRARTETIGDGKIWVVAVGSALRIRTGERDRAAI